MLINLRKRIFDNYVAIILGIAYCSGTLCTLHYAPGNYDPIPNFFSFIIVSLTCAISLFQTKRIKIPLISLAILYIFILILLQPFLTHQNYPDSLIYPLGELLSIFLLSIVIFNEKNKIKFIKIFSLFLVISAIVNSFSLIAQNFHWTIFSEWLVFFDKSQTRPEGNVAQPNQSAFIIALGMATIIYYINLKSKFNKKNNILYLFFLFISIGLGLTGSRAGIIFIVFLFLAIFLFFYINKIIHINIYILLALLIIGYSLGVYFLSHGYFTQLSGISRLIETRNGGTRTHLQEQAWLLFSQHPITGVGFGNFVESSLNNIKKLRYFTYVNNSHFIFTQIASELGILGLIGIAIFLYIIIKNIKIKTNINVFFLLIIVGIMILYSMSEFPFWYFYFLFTFIIFCSVFNQKYWLITVGFSKVFSLTSLTLAFFSIFYLHIYYSYVFAYYKIISTSDKKVQINTVINAPYVFGTSAYHDYILYKSMPISEDNIDAKIRLGYSVLSRFPSPQMMLRQGVLLALAGKSADARFLFDALCKFRYGSQCAATIAQLKVLAQDEPAHFATLYQQLAAKYPDYVEK